MPLTAFRYACLQAASATQMELAFLKLARELRFQVPAFLPAAWEGCLLQYEPGMARWMALYLPISFHPGKERLPMQPVTTLDKIRALSGWVFAEGIKPKAAVYR